MVRERVVVREEKTESSVRVGGAITTGEVMLRKEDQDRGQGSG